MIVSGTAVIGAQDQASTIKLLRETVQQAIEKKHLTYWNDNFVV